MKPEPFYMIVNVNQQEYGPPCKIEKRHAPTFCHATLQEAEKECLRLASKYSGTFVILQSVAFADWRETTVSGNVLNGLEEWAMRMGLGFRVQVRCMEKMDDPEIPF